MNVKNYIQYLGKCRREISKLANSKGEEFSYWFDYLWCAARHGCLIRQYVYGDFYRQSSIDRKESMTYRRFVKVFKRLNHPDYVHLLKIKEILIYTLLHTYSVNGCICRKQILPLFVSSLISIVLL